MAHRGSILVVDDEIGPREALRMIFKSAYNVHTASNGIEALECLHKESIDLVTLDLKMPGLSGFEVLKEIRKLNERIEVIVITGLGMVPNVREALHCGAGNFISKPFDVADIIAIVGQAFEHRKSAVTPGSRPQQMEDLRM
jgi:putative two-component system response regulator